jgi:hypothetical protein
MLVKIMHPNGELRMMLSAIEIKPLRGGFFLALCQDKLVIVNEEKIVIDSLDVIDFIKDYL